MIDKRKVQLISPQKGFTGLVKEKQGRNELCRCGSGKKTKRCCGNDTVYYSREKQQIEDIEKYKRRADK